MSDPEPIYRLFGERLRHLRQIRNLTQDAVGKRMKLTRTSIVNIEAGRQRVMLHDVSAFADIFKTTPENLLRGLFP